MHDRLRVTSVDSVSQEADRINHVDGSGKPQGQQTIDEFGQA